MPADLLQFLISGATLGAMYALAAVGFSMIYAASGVINFAQGEFIMLGGMTAALLYKLGMPLPVAVLGGVVAATGCGLVVVKTAILPARNADVIAIIIITMGAALVIRGLVQVTLGTSNYALPGFSGEVPIRLGTATLLPQTLWVIGCTAAAALALALLFSRTMSGKALLATAYNRLAAQLVGIGVNRMLMLAFGISAALGGLGGVLLTPITYTNYDVGTSMALKGFVAATLGGLGSSGGALIGGFVLGLVEALTAGYVSSAYKDAVAFLALMGILFLRPGGIMGSRSSERV